MFAKERHFSDNLIHAIILEDQAAASKEASKTAKISEIRSISLESRKSTRRNPRRLSNSISANGKSPSISEKESGCVILDTVHQLNGLIYNPNYSPEISTPSL